MFSKFLRIHSTIKMKNKARSRQENDKNHLSRAQNDPKLSVEKERNQPRLMDIEGIRQRKQ